MKMIKTRNHKGYHLPCWLLLLVLVACAACSRGDTPRWSGVERIVAIGDVHGDYQQFLAVLKLAGLIDDTAHWTGGRTHLVQTGDVLDRGAESYRILELLMQLEKQAEAAGGKVHFLIGNHEAMVLTGNYRYVNPAEIQSLGGQEAYEQVMDPVQGTYGRWIRRHNAIIVINDILFVHGGLSEAYAKKSLAAVNRRIQREIAGRRGGMSSDSDGPLWYRGLALKLEAEIKDHVDALCRHYAIQHLVVGHTVTKDRITSRLGGRIIMIDVGMSRAYYGNPAACLVIEKGRFTAFYPDRQEILVVR